MKHQRHTPFKLHPSKRVKRETRDEACLDNKVEKRQEKRNDKKLHSVYSKRQLFGNGEEKVSNEVNQEEIQHKKPFQTRGVVLINRLPHGFLEPQIKKFFSQFGEITRMRLIRSKKTGNSKGYAFIEFALEDVASIVAETMNNYILFGVVLGCRVLRQQQVPQGVFTHYMKHIKRGRNVDIQRVLHNRSRESLTSKKAEKILRKCHQRYKKLRDLGINVPLLSQLNTQQD